MQVTMEPVDRDRALRMRLILASSAATALVYLLLALLAFTPDLRVHHAKSYGVLLPGVPGEVSFLILWCLLLLPAWWIAWHVFRLLFQAKRDGMFEGGKIGVLMAVLSARADLPEINRSRTIVLLGALYIMAIICGGTLWSPGPKASAGGEGSTQNPPDVDVHVQRARAHALRGDYAAALRDFDTAVTMSPNVAQLRADRAVVRQVAGDLDGALQDLEEAIRLDPRLAQAYRSRAAIDVKRDRADAALKDLDVAIQLVPGDADTWANRARIHAAAGNLEAARSDYRHALQIARADWPRRAETESELQQLEK